MNALLLQTKLHMPPIRAEFVRRPRLTGPLLQRHPYKLTLISAPAGFGKTTLVSCWLTQQERPVAWLSLDENDNDPIRFFTYLVTALHQLDPKIGRTSLDLLQQADPAPSTAIITHLINDLAAQAHAYVLALDDYHLIKSQEIHDAVAFLLEHLPAQLHMVIISRTDPPLPIAKLRAKNQLVRLHGPDLRFTWAESESFLNQTMHLGLSGEQITQLEAQTEGWITGLQLTALSIHSAEDAARVIETLSGDNRFIADYLIDEVLSQQPEGIQHFLLQTSVLKRLRASLCNAVADIDSSQVILDTLERANLFIIPLDNSRKWYRYHHLFAEMLRTRLERRSPAQMAHAYRRAFEWHKAHNLLEQAIAYALDGQMYVEAADIIEEIGQHIYWRNRSNQVQQWLTELPDDLLQSRPTLRILHAYALIDSGDLQATEHTVAALQADLTNHPPAAPDARAILDGKLAALQTAVAFHRHLDLAEGRRLAERALALLPPDYFYERCVAAFHGGGFLILLGELAEAGRYLQEALALSAQVDSSVSRLLILTNLGHLAFVSGSLGQAQAYYQETYALAQEIHPRQSSTFSGSVVGLGALHYEWNDLESAATYLHEGVALVNTGEFLDRIVHGYGLMLRLHCARRDFVQANQLLQQAERVAALYNAPPRIRARMEAQTAIVALAQGKLVKASGWATRFAAEFEGPVAFQHEIPLLILIRIALAQGEFGPALTWLPPLQTLAHDQGRIKSLITIETLLAKSWQLQGDPGQAQAHLQHALALAEPEGCVRTFLDEGDPIKEVLGQLLDAEQNTQKRERGKRSYSVAYIKKLLAAFAAEPVIEPMVGFVAPSPVVPIGQQASPDQPRIYLTPRETDVLHLLATGLADAEIAEALVVTANTVRTHVKSLFNKLDVHNRTHAVTRANELGLL
ncbi:MAG: hypothetical protein KBG20_04950 [Caldilineaceae bacterium]|nr:hypothetical protein [Caldilineaceae bacterium]MBP8107319.1 hypothetical protein [Caldilineaceae bacterium]MBP8121678.1 hypothetical protein [Caldilineaceae bacterium]MBP9071622.1 hypothetical protein [Caldilineaceae bacterium]